MAKAEINKIIIETPVLVTVTEIKKEEKQTGVRLDLTMAEAETLSRLLNRVYGGQNSPAKYTARIRKALDKAGVAFEPDHYVLPDSAMITFPPYPDTQKAPPEPVNPLKGEPEVGAGFTGCKGPKDWDKPEPTLKTGDIIEFLRTYAGGVAQKGEQAVVGYQESPTSFQFTNKKGKQYWVGPEGIGNAFKVIPPVAPVGTLPIKAGDTIEFLTDYCGVAYTGEKMVVMETKPDGSFYGVLPVRPGHQHDRPREIYMSSCSEGEKFKRVAATALPRIFKTGDKAKLLVQLHAIEAGETVKTQRPGQSGWFVQSVTNGRTGFATASEMIAA